jgi:hypothetical protein
MRTDLNRQTIIENLIDPFSKEGFLSIEEVTGLIDLSNSYDKIHKTTGPITSIELKSEFKTNPLLVTIFDKIKQVIGPCEIFSSFFFYVELPHLIHNDDNINYPIVYRGITLPLELEYIGEDTGYPSLCFFDQLYLEGGARFFNKSKNIPTYYNKQVYEYSKVLNKNNNGIDKDIIEKYLTHLQIRWLEGLSFNSALRWKPTDALFFDSARLHCASDFQRQGIKSKFGMSIFTHL